MSLMKPFIQTERQQRWIDTLLEQKETFQSHTKENDANGTFPHANVQRLIDLGYTSLTLSEAYGGENITISELVSFQETLGQIDSVTALSVGWHMGVTGEVYAKKLWSDDMLAYFANEVKHGALTNRALSEAKTGSPTRGGRPGTTAIRKGTGWLIDGRKSYTTMSPALTHFLITAWVEELGVIGTFLVPKETEGVEVIETWDVMSMRASESHDVLFDQVFVEDEWFVERDPADRKGRPNPYSLHIASCYMGIAQAARDEAVQFALTHQPNSIDTTISELPNVQQHIGEMDVTLTQMRHVLYGVARLCDEGRMDTFTNEMAVAKYTVTNGALKIVDHAMRLVGGQSLRMDNPLQQHYRDVRAGLHNPPMDEMTILNAAQAALKDMKEQMN